MGIAVWLVGQAVVGLVLMIAIGVGGYMFIGRAGRPEARDTGQLLVLALMGAVAVGAFMWGVQLDSRDRASSWSWEERYCGEAGEVIFRTVDNVRGVYYEQPSSQMSGGRFHSGDGTAKAYVDPPERRYEFVESRRSADALLERHELNDGKIVASRHDAPSARYGFTWTQIGSIKDANAGVHGEEMEVFDIQTREVLARRVLYYYEPRGGRSTGYGVPVSVCPPLPVAPGYIDGQPRDSYHFVSRVLKPPALSPEEYARLYDLFPGSGSRTKQCVIGFVRVGEGVKPEDLRFERQGKNLAVWIAATGDSVVCKEYFFSLSSEGGSDKSHRIRSADGWLISDFDLKSKLEPPGQKRTRR